MSRQQPKLLTAFALVVQLADVHGVQLGTADAPVWQHAIGDGFSFQFNPAKVGQHAENGKVIPPLGCMVSHDGMVFSLFGPYYGAQIGTVEANEEQFIAAMRQALEEARAVAA